MEVRVKRDGIILRRISLMPSWDYVRGNHLSPGKDTLYLTFGWALRHPIRNARSLIAFLSRP